jgi:hypothetical protein
MSKKGRRQHMSRNRCLLGYGRVSVWVGVLLERLTGAVYHLVLVNDLQVLSERVSLYQRQHMWFMQEGHRLIFSALPDST